MTLCPNERVSNASPGIPRFVQAKDRHMRDFRDAKAMAHTLRTALATQGHTITNSQSLQLIAHAFGVADWNTLSVAIREQAAGSPRSNARAPQFPDVTIMHRAVDYAYRRKQRYATLEHLLLALIDDVDACAVMKACKIDLAVLKDKLTGYIDDELKPMVIDGGGEPKRSAAFERVDHRAARSFCWRYSPSTTAPPRVFSVSRT